MSVFIPTTPNPTSGFLVLVPADTVTKLDMSVADGVKYIVSLGAIAPELPLGKAVTGLGKGETAHYKLPNGKEAKVDIVSVEPYKG